MKRVLYLDLCRGLTVLFIPIIHCVMLYSKGEVHHSWLGKILAFIAEYPGGQLFMFIMGMWLAKSDKPLLQHIYRAVVLLACGYLLNTLKYVLPAAMGVLPEAFITQNGFDEDRLLVELFTIGDILHFSSIALVTTAVIKQFSSSLLIAALLLIVIVLFSPAFWDLQSDVFIAQHLYNLIGGHPNAAFFPLFPWMAFVLAGFVIGGLMRESIRDMATMFVPGAVLAITGYVLKPGNSLYGFYRTETAATCLHLGFVLMWIPFWRWITPVFIFHGYGDSNQHKVIISIKEIASFLAMTLRFCSENITAIYFIQWVVIAWMFPLVGYRTLNVWQSLAIGVTVTLLVLTVTWLYSTVLISPTKHSGLRSKFNST